MTSEPLHPKHLRADIEQLLAESSTTLDGDRTREILQQMRDYLTTVASDDDDEAPDIPPEKDWRDRLLQPFQDELEGLRQHRNRLAQEVARLENSDPQADVQPKSQPKSKISSEDESVSPLLNPEERRDHLQAVQAEADQLLMNLDGNLRTIFDGLLANLQGYETSLTRSIQNIYNFSQQGEAIVAALVRQLGARLDSLELADSLDGDNSPELEAAIEAIVKQPTDEEIEEMSEENSAADGTELSDLEMAESGSDDKSSASGLGDRNEEDESQIPVASVIPDSEPALDPVLESPESLSEPDQLETNMAELEEVTEPTELAEESSPPDDELSDEFEPDLPEPFADDPQDALAEESSPNASEEPEEPTDQSIQSIQSIEEPLNPSSMSSPVPEPESKPSTPPSSADIDDDDFESWFNADSEPMQWSSDQAALDLEQDLNQSVQQGFQPSSSHNTEVDRELDGFYRSFADTESESDSPSNDDEDEDDEDSAEMMPQSRGHPPQSSVQSRPLRDPSHFDRSPPPPSPELSFEEAAIAAELADFAAAFRDEDDISIASVDTIGSLTDAIALMGESLSDHRHEDDILEDSSDSSQNSSQDDPVVKDLSVEDLLEDPDVDRADLDEGEFEDNPFVWREDLTDYSTDSSEDKTAESTISAIAETPVHIADDHRDEEKDSDGETDSEDTLDPPDELPQVPPDLETSNDGIVEDSRQTPVLEAVAEPEAELGLATDPSPEPLSDPASRRTKPETAQSGRVRVPPPIWLENSHHRDWYLGIDWSDRGLSARLSCAYSGKQYRLGWQPDSDQPPLFDLPAIARQQSTLPPPEGAEDGPSEPVSLPTWRVGFETRSLDEGIIFDEFEQVLGIMIPWRSRRGGLEPILGRSLDYDLPLVSSRDILTRLFKQLKTAQLYHPGGQKQAADLPPFAELLPKLGGVIIREGLSSNDAFRFNVREAALQAGLVPRPDRLGFCPAPLAALVSALNGSSAELDSDSDPEISSQPSQSPSQSWVVDLRERGRTLVMVVGAREIAIAPFQLSPASLSQLPVPLGQRRITYGHRDLADDLLIQLMFASNPDWCEQLGGMELQQFPRCGAADRQHRIALQQWLDADEDRQAARELARQVLAALQRGDRTDFELAGRWRRIQRQQFDETVLVPFFEQLNQDFNQFFSELGLSVEGISRVLLSGDSANGLLDIAPWLNHKLPNAVVVTQSPPSALSAVTAYNNPIAAGLAEFLHYPLNSTNGGQQYSDFFLLQELLETVPDQPISCPEAIARLELRGIHLGGIESRIIAFLHNQLPPGFIPTASDEEWLTPESRQVPFYEKLATTPLFQFFPESKTYQIHRPLARQLLQYLNRLTAETRQSFSEPLSLHQSTVEA